jgi:hypothetical protein
VKQRCYFNQIIAINDNQTSNLPSQIRTVGNRAKRRERETQRERIRGEIERSSVGVKK